MTSAQTGWSMASTVQTVPLEKNRVQLTFLQQARPPPVMPNLRVSATTTGPQAKHYSNSSTASR
jgi:hypothetical protein